ncbi:hypothetical protein DFAR_1770009 [Desulfarculales bacterium]
MFLTNHHKLTASIVADIYKDRWKIELLFKVFKQNLKVKTFVGASSNDLEIQIWTALIALLLFKGASPFFPGCMVAVQPGRHDAPKSLHIQGLLGSNTPIHPAPHAQTGPLTVLAPNETGNRQ